MFRILEEGHIPMLSFTARAREFWI